MWEALSMSDSVQCTCIGDQYVQTAMLLGCALDNVLDLCPISDITHHGMYLQALIALLHRPT